MYATTRCFYTHHKIIHSGPYLTESCTVKIISEICKDCPGFLLLEGIFMLSGHTSDMHWMVNNQRMVHQVHFGTKLNQVGFKNSVASRNV